MTQLLRWKREAGAGPRQKPVLRQDAPTPGCEHLGRIAPSACLSHDSIHLGAHAASTRTTMSSRSANPFTLSHRYQGLRVHERGRQVLREARCATNVTRVSTRSVSASDLFTRWYALWTTAQKNNASIKQQIQVYYTREHGYDWGALSCTSNL